MVNARRKITREKVRRLARTSWGKSSTPYFYLFTIKHLFINEAIWVKTYLLVRRFAFKNSELARHEKNQKNRCLFAWLFFGNGCFCPALPR
jgi:hypothetical protein